MLTSKRVLRRSHLQFLIPHPATWLRTGCFSEPTFRNLKILENKPSFAYFIPFPLLWSSFALPSLLWLFPRLLLHLSIIGSLLLTSFSNNWKRSKHVGFAWKFCVCPGGVNHSHLLKNPSGADYLYMIGEKKKLFSMNIVGWSWNLRAESFPGSRCMFWDRACSI